MIIKGDPINGLLLMALILILLFATIYFVYLNNRIKEFEDRFVAFKREYKKYFEIPSRPIPDSLKYNSIEEEVYYDKKDSFMQKIRLDGFMTMLFDNQIEYENSQHYFKNYVRKIHGMEDSLRSYIDEKFKNEIDNIEEIMYNRNI